MVDGTKSRGLHEAILCRDYKVDILQMIIFCVIIYLIVKFHKVVYENLDFQCASNIGFIF